MTAPNSRHSYGVSSSGGSGTVTHTGGNLTNNQLVLGAGSADIKVGDLSGDVTTSGSNATTVVKINGTTMSGLSTGILKNTTGTGVPSIAVSGDFPTLNQNTTGSAAKWTTARTLAGNSVDGSANVAFANAVIAQGTADAGLSGAQFLGVLSTGIVKNTTTTGVLSIAVAGDFPTLNQNTTGSAATLTTPRAIYGQNFDGSAALSGTVTANALVSVAGTAESISTTAAAQTASTTAGVGLTITADNAVAGSTNAGAAKGGNVTITSGNAAQKTSGNANGGDIVLTPGTGIGTGTSGSVLIINGTNITPSLRFTDDGSIKTGLYADASHHIFFSSGGTGGVMYDGNAQHVALVSGSQLRWSSSSSDPTSSYDTNIFRSSAHTLTFGDTSGGKSSIIIGAINQNIVTKTGNYTATDVDYTILCDTTSAGFTVALPASSGATGRIYNIKKISSDSNTLTVDANASETIDGSLTKTTTTQYFNYMIQCNGSNWFIL